MTIGYLWLSENDGVEVRGWLKNENGRVIATGLGPDDRTALRNAFETATDEKAKAHLKKLLSPGSSKV